MHTVPLKYVILPIQLSNNNNNKPLSKKNSKQQQQQQHTQPTSISNGAVVTRSSPNSTRPAFPFPLPSSLPPGQNPLSFTFSLHLAPPHTPSFYFRHNTTNPPPPTECDGCRLCFPVASFPLSLKPLSRSTNKTSPSLSPNTPAPAPRSPSAEHRSRFPCSQPLLPPPPVLLCLVLASLFLSLLSPPSYSPLFSGEVTQMHDLFRDDRVSPSSCETLPSLCVVLAAEGGQ